MLALTDPKSPRVESVPNGVSSTLFGNQDTIPLMQTRLAFTPGFLLIAVVTRPTRGVRHRDPELGFLGGVASFYKVGTGMERPPLWAVAALALTGVPRRRQKQPVVAVAAGTAV